ncbi:hypothetical protein J6590_015581 [Homalodisca vitripennis]|nr:hypothetical protein J6590_015581 [Homalodisca vitripennis]
MRSDVLRASVAGREPGSGRWEHRNTAESIRETKGTAINPVRHREREPADTAVSGVTGSNSKKYIGMVQKEISLPKN